MLQSRPHLCSARQELTAGVVLLAVKFALQDIIVLMASHLPCVLVATTPTRGPLPVQPAAQDTHVLQAQPTLHLPLGCVLWDTIVLMEPKPLPVQQVHMAPNLVGSASLMLVPPAQLHSTVLVARHIPQHRPPVL